MKGRLGEVVGIEVISFPNDQILVLGMRDILALFVVVFQTGRRNIESLFSKEENVFCSICQFPSFSNELWYPGYQGKQGQEGKNCLDTRLFFSLLDTCF